MSDLKRFQHLKIQLEAIKSATNNFAESHCIGRGGFGKVYKGELVHSGGHTTVAIKCLDRAFGQGDREFWNEILMLSLYKHENIVSLLGFCDDGGQRILIYEYASKRALDLYIKSKELTWVRRLKICIGAARGLANLHDPAGSQQRVLHRDIKSSNILLDENWNAMIADFGLSKFCPATLQYSLMFSNPVGTFGYWDPLYIESGILTKESDVYSFGVVLFEILCGRLCTDNNDKSHSFTELVRKHYKQNSLNEIVFGNMKDEINASSFKAFSSIAYQCLKRDRQKRPLMNEIVKTLETALEYQVPQLHTGLLSSNQLSKELETLYVKSLADNSRMKNNGGPDSSTTIIKRTLLGSQPLEPLQSFYCPITGELMVDPVETSSGHTFERTAIEKWLSDGNGLCPLTMIPLDNLILRPNISLRQSIEEWKDRNTKVYADDIETEVNSYFHQMFSGQLTVEAMIQMLFQFKESSVKREQSIFKCVIGSLIEEYKFFNEYPDKQLKLVASLFGLLIKNQLVTHLKLDLALQNVLNALRKPADPKMFVFGTLALEKFVDRLIEWPGYCQDILQISHLRDTHSELVASVEKAAGQPFIAEPEFDVHW